MFRISAPDEIAEARNNRKGLIRSAHFESLRGTEKLYADNELDYKPTPIRATASTVPHFCPGRNAGTGPFGTERSPTGRSMPGPSAGNP